MKRINKTFADYEKEAHKKYLESIGKKYWTKKREQEFYQMPSFKKNMSAAEIEINRQRKNRYENLRRAIKRYEKKDKLVVTPELERNKNIISKGQYFIENEPIFGNNVKELQSLIDDGLINRIRVFDKTKKDNETESDNAKLIYKGGYNLNEALKKTKENFKGNNNFIIDIVINGDEAKIVVKAALISESKPKKQDDDNVQQ